MSFLAQSQTDHQANLDGSISHEQEAFKPFRVGFVIGHTYIPNSYSNGKQTLALPDFGLDLEYWFNEKWALGMHNEVLLQSIEIHKGSQEILEREFPVVLSVDLIYKPWKDLVLLIGYGQEFETKENLNLIRFGVEYEIEIRKGWDVAPSLVFDSRFGVYDTLALGIGLGKRF